MVSIKFSLPATTSILSNTVPTLSQSINAILDILKSQFRVDFIFFIMSNTCVDVVTSIIFSFAPDL